MGSFFPPIYFVTAILGHLASRKVLYIYFITGYLLNSLFNWNSFSPTVAFFGCFTSVHSCGTGIVGGGWPSSHGLYTAAWGRDTLPSMSIQETISKQNIFSMKELVLRQLVFWSRITKCTSQQVKNTAF